MITGGMLASSKKEDFRANTLDSSNIGDHTVSNSRRLTMGRMNVSSIRASVLRSPSSTSSAATDATEDTERTSSSSGRQSHLARTVSESVVPPHNRLASPSTVTAATGLNSREHALATNVLSRFKLGNITSNPIGAVTSATALGRFMAAVHQVLKSKKYVPYVIIKQGGVIVRVKASKDGGAGKMIGCNERVMVYARKNILGVNWFRCRDGWIQETINPHGDKMLVPVAQVRQPIGAEILSTRIVEVTPKIKKGWFYNDPMPDNTFAIRFAIDILCPEDTKIKIHRSYSEIIAVRKALLLAADKSIVARVSKLSFPTNADGDLDLLCYTTYMVEFVDSVGTWLREVVRFVNVDRCKVKEYKLFLTPNEEDFTSMEVDLCAQGGMGGAFEDEIYSGAAAEGN
jgi:hypothetical protein